MGEFLRSGPKVCYIWLIAKPCVIDKNAELPSELWAGKTARAQPELLAGVTPLGTVVHGDSGWNGTLSLYVGEKEKVATLENRLAGMKSPGHHKYAS